MGDDMERVAREREAQIVLVAGMDDPPALNLAGPHAGFELQPYHVSLHRPQERQRLLHHGARDGLDGQRFSGFCPAKL